METITIQGKEFQIGKLKGKHLRQLAKIGEDDSLKFLEVILGVDEAFVDEMDADEIQKVSELVEKENPNAKKR